jgi:hypothetical protein
MYRFVVLLNLVAAVLLFGCRDAKVASYRVPAEKPEPLPPILTGAVDSAASASAPAGASSSMANTAVPTATGESLTWTAPETWKAKPASAMRKGSYAVTGDGGEADLSITAFPGDVGGELANFNRWRNQLELPPLNENEMAEVVTRLDQNELHLAVVEFVNHKGAKPQRIVGALVPYAGATWFFKLMGPEALVAREKPTFFAFLQTVKPAEPANK